MILKYKVYEKLELRGIEPFNTLIGSFRYNEDANKFLKEKQKETYDNNTVRKSFFVFCGKRLRGESPLFFCAPIFNRYPFLMVT